MVLSAYLFVWLVYLWVCLCGVYGCVLVWLVVMLSVGVFWFRVGWYWLLLFVFYVNDLFVVLV